MLSSRGRRLSGSSWRLITEWHLLLTNAACRLKGWKRIPRSGSPGTKSLASGSCQIFVSLRQQLKAIIHDIGISKEFLSNFFLISRFGMRIFFHEYSISCILEKPKQFLNSSPHHFLLFFFFFYYCCPAFSYLSNHCIHKHFLKAIGYIYIYKFGKVV